MLVEDADLSRRDHRMLGDDLAGERLEDLHSALDDPGGATLARRAGAGRVTVTGVDADADPARVLRLLSEEPACRLWADPIRATRPAYVAPAATLIRDHRLQARGRRPGPAGQTTTPGLMHAAIAAHLHPALIPEVIDFALTAVLPGYADRRLSNAGPHAAETPDEQPRALQENDG